MSKDKVNAGLNQPVTAAELTPKQARVACGVYDNGRTPGSSSNTGGEPIDFFRFTYPTESKGIWLNGEPRLVGQAIGPTTGWTPQFTDNVGQNGKAGVDLKTWVPYINAAIQETGKPLKTCAAFARYAAPTWRAVKLTSVDPCFKLGVWNLCRTDTGTNYSIYPVLPESRIVKIWCREVEEKGVLRIDVYDLDVETGTFSEIEWPTWQPYQGAPPEKIPYDCFISCDEKFEPFIAEDAVSKCTAFKPEFLCAFDGEPVPDPDNVGGFLNQLETLAVFQWDCEGSLVTEIYTEAQYNDSLDPNSDPLDPTDQYVLPGNGVIRNCDGSAYVPPAVSPEDPCEDAQAVKICCVHICKSGDGAVNTDRNGINNSTSTNFSSGEFSGATFADFKTALEDADHEVTVVPGSKDTTGHLSTLTICGPKKIESINYSQAGTPVVINLTCSKGTCDSLRIEANTAAIKELCEKPTCTLTTLYQVEKTPGALENKWTVAGVALDGPSNATGHDYLGVFTDTDAEGYPAHPNDPNISNQVVNVAATTNVLNASGIPDDQATLDFWLCLTEPQDLVEFAGTAEAVGIWMSSSCGSSQMSEVLNGAYLNTSQNIIGNYSAGLWRVRLYHHDITANGVARLWYLDAAGNRNAIPLSWISQSRPRITPVKAWICDDGKIWNIDKTRELFLSDTLLCEDIRCSGNNSNCLTC